MAHWHDDLVTYINDDDKDGILSVLQRLPNIPGAIEELKQKCEPLIVAACQKGFADVLQYLIEIGIDLSTPCSKESPIQVACKFNQVGVLDLLLKVNVPILPNNIKAWEEESPLYIASKNGNKDCLEKLIDNDPGLIKDDQVRHCLLYASCLGGNIEAVKRWFTPGIDINHPLQLVKRLTNCESLTPLYAACSGGHQNIIEFLHGNFEDLQLTAFVCQEFPDVIGQYLQQYFKGDNSSDDDIIELYKGRLAKKNLHLLHPDWFSKSNYFMTLAELDISNNSLTELPSCLPWSFQNLRSLNVSRNSLKLLTFCGEDELEDCPCPSLEDFNLSYNNLECVCRELFGIEQLKHLDLSHNKLVYLSKSLRHQGEALEDSVSTLRRQSYIQDQKWKCDNLRKLNVSHNALEMFPTEIQACLNLIHIVANNNRLITFPQPWDCPLEILDLSHNRLERFPVNTEVFWGGTLRLLNISHNSLDEINESIVRLGVLTELIACNNKIDRLPSPEVWECSHLHNLNLKHNKLGVHVDTPTNKSIFPVLTRKRVNSKDYDNKSMNFPKSLAYCLKELRLSDNSLDCVPLSVCDLISLEVLDLSENPLIKTLPRELGRLKNCGMMKLKGVSPTNVNVPASGNRTREILSELLEKLRDCQPYYKMKAVVLGKKDKGKTTLVNILANKKHAFSIGRKSIVREEVVLMKKSFSLTKKDPEIRLNMWDISGDEVYTQIHHSVFTPFTLYIIVWDFWSITEELDKIEKWINNIQASTSNYKVVLVGTFVDKLSPLKPDTVQAVKDKLNNTFRDQALTLCPVSCINHEGIDNLKTCLYEKALCMTLPGRQKLPLIGRKIPKSYMLMEKLIVEEQKKLEMENKPLCLTQNQFLEIIESLPDKHNDLQSSEETAAVTKFLEEAGYLLHFSDQLGALDTLYFLDPAWLCDILVYVLMSTEGKKLLKQGRGKISRKDAEKIYRESDQFPTAFVDQYLELLERFEIAASISQSEYLFFPCQLPIEPPIIETADEKTKVTTLRRLYRMADCPNGFWMRLVTRMMVRVEQFSRKDWHFPPILTHSERTMSIRRQGGSFNKDQKRGNSFYGLQIKGARKTFCRELIHVSHEDGSFCVEPVMFAGTGSGDRESLQNGILITEVSKTGNFGIIGIIADEIEDIVQDFYPGLMEIDMLSLTYRLERYALCSACYQGQPLPNIVNHFTMEHCARLLVNGTTITCPKGVKQELSDLVPDLLMQELPEKFFMDISKLELAETKQNCLGTGVTGSVFKGKYDGQAVAIKVYRSDIRNKLGNGRFTSLTSDGSDSGRETRSTQGSVVEEEEEIYVNINETGRTNFDLDETEKLKALRAIKEMRQEVAITSRLHHPCIISLVGLAFRPKLMMALELAPLGSLRCILDKEMQGRPVFNRYKNKDELFSPLFEKELVFKFVYQIAKGLEYLHTNAIIYKDLKSDNILTMSLDLSAHVNLKLSDYGISKYNWSGRSVGLVGTPGYQAPEILDGKAYDEKVDIFAFSMVIYEILTGRRPFAECDNLAQITKAMKLEDRRPNLKDFNVNTRFPALEKLMKDCWHITGQTRPTASEIASKHNMQNLQFLAQTWAVEMPDNLKLGANCTLGSFESDEKSLLCVWDGYKSERHFSLLHPKWSTFSKSGEKYEGPQVVCMAQVGDHIWVGTQENNLTVFERTDTGSLKEFGNFALDSCPVQILAIPDKQSRRGQQSHTIYVAVVQGSVLQFQSLMKRKGHMRKPVPGTIKQIPDYTGPTVCLLRSRSVYCMGFAEVKSDLWVSGDGHIDIVHCPDFKVDAEVRINLKILLRMCKIHPELCVGQMDCTKTQMFCMLDYSPFVLEFDADAYTCKSIINLEARQVIWEIKAKAFPDTDHDAYHGNASAGYYRDRDSSVNKSLSDKDTESSSDDEDEEISDSTFQSASQFWTGRAKSDSVGPGRSDSVGPGNSSGAEQDKADKPPQLPTRTRHSRKAFKVLGITSGSEANPSDDSPIVPPRPPRPKTEHHGSPSRKVIPHRKAPPIPPKHSTVDFPRASKPSISKQSPFSLPNLPKHKGFAIELTSILIVKNSLWVGRSSGDICIVNIQRSQSGELDRFGKVVADMYDMNKRAGKRVDSVKLVKTGGHIAAAYTLHDGNSSEVEMAFWDCYGVEDTERIGKYWGLIQDIEKDLLHGNKLPNKPQIEIGKF